MQRDTPFVREAGKGPTVLCLHSSSGSSKQWLPLMERLAPRYRALAVDFCAHGRTSWAGGGGDALDEDVRLVEAAAGDAAVHLVGHSYGGAVALRYALLHPHRVRSLLLYEPATWHLVGGEPVDGGAREVLAAGRRIRALLAAGCREQAARLFVDYWNGADAWEATAVGLGERILAQMDRIGAHFASVFADPPPLGAYAALGMPALLMCGTASPRCGSFVVERLAARMPRARIERFAGMGHMGPVASAGEVNEAIADFLDALTWRAGPVSAAAPLQPVAARGEPLSVS